MDEQMQKLKAIFKRRENSQDEDDGDDNTFGEYWEFQESNEVKFWSLELNPMTGRTHFVHKFKNSSLFLMISYNERVKDVLFERRGIILIHCVTTIGEPYMFTIYLDYNISPFDLLVFLKSLENSDYKSLMKEIEEHVDKKKWLNKEGLPFGTRAMASRVRQLIVSLDIMIASNKHILQQMKAIEQTRNVTSHGRSIESALPTPLGAVSSAQGDHQLTVESSFHRH
jgi:hypothetical protein